MSFGRRIELYIACHRQGELEAKFTPPKDYERYSYGVWPRKYARMSSPSA
jgi:hypothetical protein